MRLALLFVLFLTGCAGKEITVSREELKDIKVVDVMV